MLDIDYKYYYLDRALKKILGNVDDNLELQKKGWITIQVNDEKVDPLVKKMRLNSKEYVTVLNEIELLEEEKRRVLENEELEDIEDIDETRLINDIYIKLISRDSLSLEAVFDILSEDFKFEKKDFQFKKIIEKILLDNRNKKINIDIYDEKYIYHLMDIYLKNPDLILNVNCMYAYEVKINELDYNDYEYDFLDPMMLSSVHKKKKKSVVIDKIFNLYETYDDKTEEINIAVCKDGVYDIIKKLRVGKDEDLKEYNPLTYDEKILFPDYEYTDEKGVSLEEFEELEALYGKYDENMVVEEKFYNFFLLENTEENIKSMDNIIEIVSDNENNQIISFIFDNKEIELKNRKYLKDIKYTVIDDNLEFTSKYSKTLIVNNEYEEFVLVPIKKLNNLDREFLHLCSKLDFNYNRK